MPQFIDVNPSRPASDDIPAARLEAWLAKLGLQFNPFDPITLNAGGDAHLSAYLIGHDEFATIWGDWISTLLAPTGGGKTAFRVRLAHAARIGEDGRRIFPIVYPLPRATTLETHLENLTRAAAYELLLELVYRPGRFESLDNTARRSIRRALDQNAPGWERFLPQLERAGGLAPLAETFDRSAAGLANPPAPDRVRKLCSALGAVPPDSSPPSVTDRWPQLVKLLLETLRFESIYILVDGADAYPETTAPLHSMLGWLGPLLDQAHTWAKERAFVKLFLPIELYNLLRLSYAHLLTFPARFAKIIWTPERLAEVLAARLRVASEGEFDSLDALCTPALRGLNRELASLVRPTIPREVLVLTHQVLVEHVRKPGAGDLIEPEDLEAAKEWYHRDRLMAGSP